MGRRGRSAFDYNGNTYFITTTVIKHIKIFSFGDRYYDILINSLKFLIHKNKAQLICFVLMPNHIHLILFLPEGKGVSDFMRDFKHYTSGKIKHLLESEMKINLLKKLKELSGTGKYKLWMDRFDDLIITSDKTLETKMNYIHFNPVKAGLVAEMTEWKYSSARNYYLDDNSVIEVSKAAF